MAKKKTDLRVSSSIDTFIAGDEKDLPYWYVILSNNECIYQDDYRYGEYDLTIDRLRNYCKKNKLSIKKAFVKFRSHTELAVSLDDGDSFFFRKKVLGSFSSDRNSHYYLFGKVKNNKIYVNHWKIPELILEESDERDLTDDCEESIIWNYSPQ